MPQLGRQLVAELFVMLLDLGGFLRPDVVIHGQDALEGSISMSRSVRSMSSGFGT